jgi:hypothetical protein
MPAVRAPRRQLEATLSVRVRAQRPLGDSARPRLGRDRPPSVGVCSQELGHQAGPVTWAWLALAWFAVVPLAAVALGRMMRNADEEEVARADTRPTPFEVGLPVPMFWVVHRRDVGRS